MTARLAGILTLLKDPAATLVDVNEYEFARSMMEEYFIPHMRYAFCGEHKLSATAEIVLKNMIGCLTRNKRYVLVSTLWDKLRGKHGFPKNGGSQVLDKDLAELAAAGMIRPAETAAAPTGRPSKGAWEVRPELLANVPALQPRRTGAELSKYFPQYLSGPKSMAEALEAMQQDQEDDGLPF